VLSLPTLTCRLRGETGEPIARNNVRIPSYTKAQLERNGMNKHIKLLAALYMIWGAMGAVALLVLLALTAIGGGLAAMDDPKAGFILGTIGMIAVMIAAVASLPNIIAGLGLLKYREWARILTLVLCFIHLPAFPLGTALGGYGIWVLFHAEVVEIFRRGSARPVTSEPGRY
jgi:hypothetical protein